MTVIDVLRTQSRYKSPKGPYSVKEHSDTPYQRLRLYNGAPFSRLLRHAGDTEDVFSAKTPGVATGVGNKGKICNKVQFGDTFKKIGVMFDQ